MARNKKFSIVNKTKNKRVVILSLILLVTILLKTTPTSTYAQGLFQLVVGVSVQPYYKIHVQGNALYISTNMNLYINNKKIIYDH